MRVALVAEDYYPQVGGVPEHVHHLAAELNERGHATTIVTSHMDRGHVDPPHVRRVGISLVIRSNGGVARVTTGWRLTARLARLFRDGGYDLVHIQCGLAPTLGLLGPRAALRAGVPFVATFHSWFPRSVGYRLFRRPLQRLLNRHAATIAVSQPVIAAMSRYFDAPWEIIPNGVDVDRFHPDGRPDRPSGEPRLLFLGRLEERNDLETVLRAMPAIRTAFPKVRLTVAGDGPLRTRYERLAASLGGSVEFVGQVFDDRPERYRAADLYLCPTTRASFGITLLEAMASGTPLAVSDIVGFRELIEGGAEAVRVPPRQPEAWAAAVIALLRDPARRAAMSVAARQKALTFAWPAVTDRVLDVYRRVLGTG